MLASCSKIYLFLFTLVYSPGWSGAAQTPPHETAPYNIGSFSLLMQINGPPESPWQASRPPLRWPKTDKKDVNGRKLMVRFELTCAKLNSLIIHAIIGWSTNIIADDIDMNGLEEIRRSAFPFNSSKTCNETVQLLHRFRGCIWIINMPLSVYSCSYFPKYCTTF